jgi:hypothetical protein
LRLLSLSKRLSAMLSRRVFSKGIISMAALLIKKSRIGCEEFAQRPPSCRPERKLARGGTRAELGAGDDMLFLRQIWDVMCSEEFGVCIFISYQCI